MSEIFNTSAVFSHFDCCFQYNACFIRELQKGDLLCLKKLLSCFRVSLHNLLKYFFSNFADCSKLPILRLSFPPYPPSHVKQPFRSTPPFPLRGLVINVTPYLFDHLPPSLPQFTTPQDFNPSYQFTTFPPRRPPPTYAGV